MFLGYFSDFEVKSLLLKTPYTLNTGLAVYELDLTEKPPYYSLDLIVQEGFMHAAKEVKIANIYTQL